MVLSKRNFISTSLVVLILSWINPASATEADDWSERHHAYIEECKYDNGQLKKPCRLVFYTLAHDGRIGFQLKNPQKAAAIPQIVEDKIQAEEESAKDKELESLAQGCGVTDGKLLEYKALKEKNLNFASYKVNGDKCGNPGGK